MGAILSLRKAQLGLKSQLTQQGTIGGISVKPRCWYYRENSIVLKRRRRPLFCLAGRIITTAFRERLLHVHPSDTAPASRIWCSRFNIEGRKESKLPIENFICIAFTGRDERDVLEPGEIVTEICSRSAKQMKSSNRKVRARRSWTLPLQELL